MKIKFSKEYFKYDSNDYPFSEFKNNNIIYAKDIEKCIANFLPPAILTKGKNIFFISAVYKEELFQFCINNKIDKIKLQDNWSLILDEFLDTEFSEQDKQRNYDLLGKVGIEKNMCDQIRQDVGPMMFAYNFISCLWEWCYLGMFDVLEAAQAKMPGMKQKLSLEQLEEFYSWTVDIALMQ